MFQDNIVMSEGRQMYFIQLFYRNINLMLYLGQTYENHMKYFSNTSKSVKTINPLKKLRRRLTWLCGPVLFILFNVSS